MAALLLHSAWFRLAVVPLAALLQLQSVGWKKILEFQVLQLVEGLYLPVDLRGYSEEWGLARGYP